MKSSFPSHFTDDQKRIDNLWADCIFVFDTNVLTGIYKYSDETRDALYGVINSLGERLWIPYQVMFEFLDNRAKIVHDQSKLYTSAIAKLEEFKSEIESPNRHPFVSEDIYLEFCQSAEKVLNELSNKRDLHENRITSDDIKNKLSELLEGKIGPRYPKEIVDEIIAEGDLRYAQKIPPGFEDRDKHKGSNLKKETNKRYGDLVFWKQILDKAKESSSSVILVTGERKDDWWSTYAGKTIGPLPELVDEFHEITGKDFHIYSTHNFLNFANKFLQQHTSSSAVEEIRDSFIEDTAQPSLVIEFSLAESEFDDFDSITSPARKHDASYYEQQEIIIKETISENEKIIKNIQQKLSEAKLKSSPNVVEIYHERLTYALKKRSLLRMKLRYHHSKLVEILRDELI